MSLLRSLFGASTEEVWRELAVQVGGDLVDGGFWKSDKVIARVKEWTLTLDLYTVSTGKSHVTYTRLRAPYVNSDGFRFTIYRKSIFSGLGKMLGMQDLEMGDPSFDEAFILQGNNPEKVRALFSHEPLRQLISAQPRFSMTVRDDEGWFATQFPEGVDELCFQVPEIVRDVQRLRDLFTIFGLTLHLLCHLGSAYEDDPRLQL
jgi:hypothetical protein